MQNFYRSLVITFLFVLPGNIHSQDMLDSAALEIRKNITPEHQLIPGTHLYLIPPAGFTPSLTFPGFEQDETGFIRILDERKPFNPQEVGFCDALKITGEGGRVIDQREISLHGYPARYLLWQNDPAFMLITICMGDTGFAATIQARFKAYDEAMLNSIKQCLFSIVYDKLRTVVPFEGTFFTMDYTSGPLRLTLQSPGNYYFASKGAFGSEEIESHATLSWFNINQTTTAIGIADENLEREHPENTDQTMIRRVSTRLINGHDALEREIYIPENGRKFLMYQGIILFYDKAVMLQGYAYERFGENLEIFRNMLSSVKGKKEE
ncbi:MAG: hypothetical protein U0T82_12385 [Bacteroidales bacterium]